MKTLPLMTLIALISTATQVALPVSDHGDHPIACDHPIVSATKILLTESQIVQSG